MRMWMIDPTLLCKNHLLGEHYEIHKAVGNLRNKKKWANNLIKSGYLEPQKFKSRHDKLVKEMLKRGYNHNSPLDITGIQIIKGNVDTDKSIHDLTIRCKECRLNISREINLNSVLKPSEGKNTIRRVKGKGDGVLKIYPIKKNKSKGEIK